MKKVFKIVGLILMLILAVFFLMLMQHKSFDELYTGDEKTKTELTKFRTYPTKSISLNGVNWNYLDRGTGQQTLLMLHGMGGAYDIWFQQINALASDFRIIAVTYPPTRSLDELTAGIIEILDREGIEKTNIIGTSLGGYLTQFLLKHFPNRLEKVIIANSFPPNHQLLAKNGNLAKVVPYVPEWLLMKIFRKNIKTKVVPAANNNPLVKAYLLEQDYGLMSKEQFVGRLQCVLQYFEPAPANSITQDVLIIESDNDPLIPPDLRDSLKMFYPTAQIHTFHNTGHFTYLNKPNEYTNVIRAFLLGSNGQAIHAIKSLINKFYFKGRKEGNVQLLATAFDENASLITVKNNEEIVTSIADYLKMVGAKGSVTCKTEILTINVAGTIAMAKTRFDYGPVAYIDFLMLEKRNDTWKIKLKLYIKE